MILDLRKNFNKVIAFNEVNQTITVQPGISGPDLEKSSTTHPKTSARHTDLLADISRSPSNTAA